MEQKKQLLQAELIRALSGQNQPADNNSAANDSNAPCPDLGLTGGINQTGSQNVIGNKNHITQTVNYQYKDVAAAIEHQQQQRNAALKARQKQLGIKCYWASGGSALLGMITGLTLFVFSTVGFLLLAFALEKLVSE